jgi:hypothetical protein
LETSLISILTILVSVSIGVVLTIFDGNNTNITFPASGGNNVFMQNMNELMNNYSVMEALWV